MTPHKLAVGEVFEHVEHCKARLHIRHVMVMGALGVGLLRTRMEFLSMLGAAKQDFS